MIDTHAEDRPSAIEHLRDTVAARAENTSLRNVAREIGMSASGLKKFLQGTAPHSPTLRRLRTWYVRYAAKPRGIVGEKHAQAALQVLVHDLAPESRRRTVSRLADCLARGYEESGETPPRWISGLREDRPPPAAGPADPAGQRPRRSAFGKYRGILSSSEEFAGRKQEEIDREDQIPTCNTYSTRAQ